MRFSSQESATLVAALSFLQAHLSEGGVPEQFKHLKPLTAFQMKRLSSRISSGEKELVYIGVHGGVASISATKGCAIVHADFDTLEADPDHSLPYLDKGRSAKRTVLTQIDEGLERLLELRSVKAGKADMNKLRRRLWRMTGGKRLLAAAPASHPKQKPEANPAHSPSSHFRFTLAHGRQTPLASLPAATAHPETGAAA